MGPFAKGFWSVESKKLTFVFCETCWHMKLTTVFNILDLKFDSHKSETKVSIFNIFQSQVTNQIKGVGA